MSGVVRLASVLLFFSLVLTASRFAPGGREEVELGGEVALLVSSRGHLLPQAKLEGGKEVLEDTICVDELILKDPNAKPGLRVVRLDPGGAFRDVRSFESAWGGEDSTELRRTLESVRRGGLVILAVQGDVRPAPEHLAGFDQVVAELGARVSPFRAPSASWAFVAARLERGWTPLSEVYSEERGVSLSFLAERDVETYAGTEGSLYLARGEDQLLLSLYDSFLSAGAQSSAVYRHRYSSAAGVNKKSISLPATIPAAEGGAFLRWERLRLGSDPMFTLQAALQPGVTTPAGGVDLSLRIDGEEADSLSIPTRSAGWRRWTVDLAAWAGREVSFELLAAGAGGAGRVLLGEPLLRWSPASVVAAEVVPGGSGAPGGSGRPQAVEDPPVRAADEPSDVPSRFNGRVLRVDPAFGAYTYLVGGHLYGAPRNQESIFPSASLLGNLRLINESGAAFFMSLGDCVRYPGPKNFAALRSGFAERIEMPLFNVVGNHDVAHRDNYVREFPGPTRGKMRHGAVLHVALDTELDPGRISGNQLADLVATLAEARRTQDLGAVAIYGHKLVWLDGRTDLAFVRQRVNNGGGYQDQGEFARNVLPLLRELARTKQVVFFSGDIGIDVSFQLFYHREPDRDLTWIATGFGDTADDVLLQVHASAEGRLTFDVLRMDGKPSEPIETFGLDFWKEHFR